MVGFYYRPLLMGTKISKSNSYGQVELLIKRLTKEKNIAYALDSRD